MPTCLQWHTASGHECPLYTSILRLATLPQPRRRLRSVISEVFRVFQPKFRTSRVHLGIVKPSLASLHLRIANESEGKEEISDDWRFCTWAIGDLALGEKERSIGNRSGRPDCRDFGPKQACILFGWDTPLAIAGGLLGPKAFRGGVGTYVLGVCLHFFIACSAAAIYYAASRRLGFLKEHALVSGLFFGAAVEEVMNLIVLPLSELHARGPYQLHDLIQGLLVHMVVVGLPISFSVRRFAK
jgi:hypothetical protein